MYEYHKWLDHFSANKFFEKITCPEVTMFGPAIYFKKPQQIIDDPFTDMQTLAKPLLI